MNEFERRLRDGLVGVVAHAPRAGDRLATKIERRSLTRRRHRQLGQVLLAGALAVAVGIGAWTLQGSDAGDREVAITATPAEVGLHHAYLGTQRGVVHIDLATGSTTTLLEATKSDEYSVVVGRGEWVAALVDGIAYVLDGAAPTTPTPLGPASAMVASDAVGRVWLGTTSDGERTRYEEVDLATRSVVTAGTMPASYLVVGADRDGLVLERKGQAGVYQWTPNDPKPRLVADHRWYVASQGVWIATMKADECTGFGPGCPLELVNTATGTINSVPIPGPLTPGRRQASFSPDGTTLGLIIRGSADGAQAAGVDRKFGAVALIQIATATLSVIAGANLYIEPVGPTVWSPSGVALIYSESVHRPRDDQPQIPNPHGRLAVAGVRVSDGALVLLPGSIDDQFNTLAVL